VAALEQAYGRIGGHLPNPTCTLRYLNAFTSVHGYRKNSEFLAEQLGLDLNLRAAAADALAPHWSERQITVEVTTPLESPRDASLTIKAVPGETQGAPACIVELAVVGPTPQGSDRGQWFDGARIRARATFEALLSEQLRSAIGPRENL